MNVHSQYRIAMLVSLTFILSCGGGDPGEEIRAADRVLRNGAVYTVDPARSWAEAVAIKDGKIIYVGSNDGVGEHVGLGTEVIDLEGKMVLPGFVDSHMHPPGAALTEAVSVFLFDRSSLEGYLDAVRDYVAQNPGKTAIRGAGWTNTLFPPTGPRKEDLDKIVPDLPVALNSEDFHSLWVNSAALEMAGITRDTPDPEGGIIERDPETGEPNGTLRESAANLVSAIMPRYTAEEMDVGLLDFQKVAASEGVTMVHAAAVSLDGEEVTPEDFKRLEKSGEMAMRFRGSLHISPDIELETIARYVEERANHTGPLFQLNAVKIFVDGVVEGVTAYLLEPYAHRPDYYGELLWDPDHLNEVCAAFDKEGFQLHIHAIGDAAVRVTLDAIEHAQKVNGKRDSRGFITHIQLVADEDKPRFKQLGVIGAPQPFWFQKGDYYEQLEVPYLGQERADNEYPMQSLIDAGAMMASSSDYEVTVPFTPVVGIEQGVTRLEQGVMDPDQVLGPHERTSLEDMIASFTINGAYVNFLEDVTGSLEVGKLADVIVLDRNLFEIPETEISEAKVLLTLFEGREVFRHSGF